MNVNNNLISSYNYTKPDTTKLWSKKDEFKKTLDNHEKSSKKDLNEDVEKSYTEDENLDKANTKNSQKTNNPSKSDDIEEIRSESDITKDLDDTNVSSEIRTEIISFIEMSMNILNDSTVKQIEEVASDDKSTDELNQIQQLLQVLSPMFQAVNEITDAKTSGTKIDDINLEQLIGAEKLT